MKQLLAMIAASVFAIGSFSVFAAAEKPMGANGDHTVHHQSHSTKQGHHNAKAKHHSQHHHSSNHH